VKKKVKLDTKRRILKIDFLLGFDVGIGWDNLILGWMNGGGRFLKWWFKPWRVLVFY